MNRSKYLLLLVICVVMSGSLAADKKEAGEALLAAAADGDVDGMRQALKDGADPNVKDEDGNTPLMMISAQSLFGDEKSIIGELVEKKAKVNAQNGAGMTALMYASRENRTDAVKALLDAKASPDTKDADGWTALSYAAYNGAWGALESLVAANASVSLEDSEGWTPMMLAISNGKGNIVERLGKAGAKVPTEFHGASTLFYAIQSGDLDSFRAVIAAGAEINGRDPDGWTPLAWAAGAGQEQMVMDLLRAGADASLKDNEEKTALDHAVESDATEIIALLGGEWKKPDLHGTKVVVDCEALGGTVESWFSVDDSALNVQAVFPRPVSWYIGGGMTNRASTSKTLTYDGTVAGSIFLDVDNNPKTGPQPDMLNPGRKGAELTLDHSEYGTSVNYAYRTSGGEQRQRQVSANVIDVTVYKGNDMIDSDVWTDEYPDVSNDAGVLRTVVPLSGLGLKVGQKITVTTRFGKCESKPTAVTLK